MHRCVRVVDEDGRNVLRAANKIVEVSDSESFRDVLGKVVPDSRFRVDRVQLTHTASAQAGDASETQDLDATVTQILQFVASSQGYDPLIITYVVARPNQELAPPALASPPSTQTATGDAVAAGIQTSRSSPSGHSAAQRTGTDCGAAGDPGAQNTGQSPQSKSSPRNPNTAEASVQSRQAGVGYASGKLHVHMTSCILGNTATACAALHACADAVLIVHGGSCVFTMRFSRMCYVCRTPLPLCAEVPARCLFLMDPQAVPINATITYI